MVRKLETLLQIDVRCNNLFISQVIAGSNRNLPIGNTDSRFINADLDTDAVELNDMSSFCKSTVANGQTLGTSLR